MISFFQHTFDLDFAPKITFSLKKGKSRYQLKCLVFMLLVKSCHSFGNNFRPTIVLFYICYIILCHYYFYVDWSVLWQLAVKKGNQKHIDIIY